MDEDVACRDLINHNRYLIHYCFLSFYNLFANKKKINALQLYNQCYHCGIIIWEMWMCTVYWPCISSVHGIRNDVCTWPAFEGTIPLDYFNFTFASGISQYFKLWFRRPASGSLGGIRRYAVARLPNYIPSYTPEADIGNRKMVQMPPGYHQETIFYPSLYVFFYFI